MLRTLFVIVVVIGLLAGLGWMAFIRHDRLAPPGEELLFDDFGFSVKDVRTSKTLGPPDHLATASGLYWIVDLQVANHAKRVGYKLDSHQPAIVDAEGRRFAVSPEGEAALAAAGDAPKSPSELEHGEKCITRVVFDVPDDAREPRLKIRFGDVGSALDYLLLGDWSLTLRSQ
jgi:hypothetical protein